MNDLNSGATRESVVDGFSESAEYQSDTSTAASAFATTILNAPDYGSIFRLYGATLDRQPDAAGFVSWVDALAGGQSLASVTTSFVNSAEFQTTYGSLDNTQFVTLLYNNVLGRAPDQAGLTNWVNDLNSGATRASVVDGLSESAEYQNDTASSLKTFMATTMAPTWGETLDGAGGANTLLGGPGPDVFVFTQSDAANGVNVNDTVYGLQAWDTLDLAGFGYAKASDAMAHMTQSGNDVIFNAGLANGSNTLIDFHDTTLAALGNASFKFA